MEEEKKQRNFRRYLPYVLLLAAYLFVGSLASHPFDDAIYAQNAQFFYFFRIPPVFSLPMGLYYDLINVGGYSLTILLSLLKIQNVITIQIGVKIPFIIFAFLTAFVLYKIGREMDFNGRYASLVLLTSPIYFFTALIYGSAIIVSVFFFIASLLFIIRKRTALSAIFYGMSMGSYLYPMIAIPFLLRYFWVKEGRRNAGVFILVSSIFAAIGQLVTFLLYLSKGIQAQAPISPTTFFAPIISVQPYSPLDFLNIFNLGRIVPGETINILYYGSALIASLIYFALPRDKVNLSSLIIFLFIQGLLFSSLAPGNLPSFMAAEIPLAIIVALIMKRWVFIGLMWISSFFSFWVMQSINSVGFIIYFSDLNHKILSIRNSYPSWVANLAGSLYTISILLNILFLTHKRGKKTLSPRKTLAAHSTIVVAIVVVALVVLVPVVDNVPSNMYLSPEVNTFQGQIYSSSIVGGNLIVNYSMPLVVQSGDYEGKYISGIIEFNETRVVMYKQQTENLTEANRSYNLTVLYPLKSAEISLFSPFKGNISVYVENATGIVMPSDSSIIANGKYEYNFNFTQTLEGKYSLNVKSNVGYYSSNVLPSIIMSGSLAQTSIIIDKTVTNGILLPYQISKRISIEFEGPYYAVPAAIPMVYFYVNPTGAQFYYPYFAIGAVIFLSMIVFTVVFLRRI